AKPIRRRLRLAARRGHLRLHSAQHRRLAFPHGASRKTMGHAMSSTAIATPSRSRALAVYAALVFAFIYLPIVVLILYSFNRDGVGGFPPRHFTFDWYRILFSDSAIWDSVWNSAQVAAGAVALSLALGLLAALALDRANFPGKALFRRLVLLPL